MGGLLEIKMELLRIFSIVEFVLIDRSGDMEGNQVKEVQDVTLFKPKQRCLFTMKFKFKEQFLPICIHYG